MIAKQAALFSRADYLLARQLEDVATRGRIAAATSAFGAFVAFATQISPVSTAFFSIWLPVMLGIAMGRFSQSRAYDAGALDASYIRNQRVLVYGLSLLDCLGWASLIWFLASGAGEPDLFLLAILITGPIAGAFIFYRSLPLVTGFFVVLLASLGGALGIIVHGRLELAPLAIIIAYCLVLVRGIVDEANNYRQKFLDEAALGESTETIQLLLHDYEEQSADWLWEVDTDGRLTTVCDRFGEAAGMPVEELEAKRLVSLFLPGPAREKLAHHLGTSQPFRDLTLELEVNEERCWWTLSANRSEDGTMRGVARDTTETRQAIERVNYMAHHDMLTGLANRFLFGETLSDALDRMGPDGRLVLLYLDLDHFKAVNDTQGHSTGDLLLQKVAGRLADSVKAHDLVARLGGDEFAVLLTRISSPETAKIVAQRIIDSIGRSFTLDGQKVQIETSIGIAHFEGSGGDADDLLRKADLALYAAKALGRACFAEFDTWMEERDRERAKLEADLRVAIREGQFALHYQPLYNIDTRKTVGFETLVRWQHPEWGVVRPNEFIPLAEDSGLIVPLGEWIIRNAIAEAAAWPEGERVAINLSPLQMRSARLLPTLIAAIADTGIDPRRVELEITESVLMHDSENNVATLHKFRELGMRISLDDFGTGYSSLNYLRSFPFDKIKIDKCFVADIEKREDCQAIIQAVTGLAGSLGMDTVAEGVEREDQLVWLRNNGVTEIQGYLISYPLNAEELSDGRPFDENRHDWFRPPPRQSDAA